jgi:hypothetical protein
MIAGALDLGFLPTLYVMRLPGWASRQSDRSCYLNPAPTRLGSHGDRDATGGGLWISVTNADAVALATALVIPALWLRGMLLPTVDRPA